VFYTFFETLPDGKQQWSLHAMMNEQSKMIAGQRPVSDWDALVHRDIPHPLLLEVMPYSNAKDAARRFS
jgi:hypothetical protein